jgi:hypothetical protein
MQKVLYAITILLFFLLTILFGSLVPKIWAEAQAAHFSFDLSVGFVLVTLPSVILGLSTVWFCFAAVKSFPFGPSLKLYFKFLAAAVLTILGLLVGFFAILKLVRLIVG